MSRPRLLAVAAFGPLVGGCTLALDFSPGVLLPALDAGSADARPADVDARDRRSGDAGVGATEDRPDELDACAADLRIDPENCGRCRRRCNPFETCEAGECVTGTGCRASQTSCRMQCVDLLTDPRHCGRCDSACGPGAPRCCGGVCTMQRCP